MSAAGSDASTTPATGSWVLPAAVRAQLLATEHWSLLATRGLTWSEVMSRMTVHLTVASAALVVLALVIQTSGFGTAFRILSIGLAAVILVLGTLTAVRVYNASHEDAALIIGMNRLRAAYLEMDPAIADYLVTSAHDDQVGLMMIYTMGAKRSTASHILGSTSMFITIINAIVAGAFGALIANTLGAEPAGTSMTGVICGLAYLAATIGMLQRSFNPALSIIGSARFPTASGR